MLYLVGAEASSEASDDNEVVDGEGRGESEGETTALESESTVAEVMFLLRNGLFAAGALEVVAGAMIPGGMGQLARLKEDMERPVGCYRDEGEESVGCWVRPWVRLLLKRGQRRVEGRRTEHLRSETTADHKGKEMGSIFWGLL